MNRSEKRNLPLPTDIEDLGIAAGIAADDDTKELSQIDLLQMKEFEATSVSAIAPAIQERGNLQSKAHGPLLPQKCSTPVYDSPIPEVASGSRSVPTASSLPVIRGPGRPAIDPSGKPMTSAQRKARQREQDRRRSAAAQSLEALLHATAQAIQAGETGRLAELFDEMTRRAEHARTNSSCK